MRLVVTGTGRSGTGWCSEILNASGVFCGHERVFTPKAANGGLIDWCEYNADASWLAVPRLPLLNVRACVVVRHPLDVVASMAHIRFGQDVMRNAFSMIAEGAGMTPDLDGYLRFWVNWNRRALEATRTVFRLDQLLDDPGRLSHWAGARYEPRLDPGIVNDRPEWKTGDRPIIDWADFEDTNMVDHAQQLWEAIA